MQLPTSEFDKAAPQPWLFWGTTGWVALSLFAWFLAQLAVMVVLLSFAGINPAGGQTAAMEKLAATAYAVAISLIIAMPAQLGVVAWASRIKNWNVRDYLALYMPSRGVLLFGLMVAAILLVSVDLTSWLFGKPLVPQAMIDLYKSARDDRVLVLAILAIVVAAPVTEEIVFRGFMFRGFAASRVGVYGAIAIPALLWAVMHVQYELFSVVQIFIIGCVFGWLRWTSGTTGLTIILHMINNAIAFGQAAWWAESLK